MSLDNSKILALLNLLADNDEEVVGIAKKELLNSGPAAIPVLEDHVMLIETAVQKQYVDEIIELLKIDNLKAKIADWKNKGANDLLKIWCILSEVSGRTISETACLAEIEQIKIDIWLGLQPDQSVVEKINFFNHVFFKKYGFAGDVKDYTNPSNSYIDSVLQHKKGNPIALSCLYIIIAQKLKLPVYGVNLPQHFVLAFMNIDITLLGEADIESLTEGKDIEIPIDKKAEPLFYINPFNAGSIFSKTHLFGFLRELKIKPEKKHYTICTEKDIAERMLRNLQLSYAKSNNHVKKHTVDTLLALMYE